MKIDSKSLDFDFLPQFAQFILDNYLVDFVRENLQLAKEFQVPMLRYFGHLTDDQMLEYSIASASKLLAHLAKNNARQQIDEAMQAWLTDQLPQVNRNQILAEDITIISHIRKQCFLKFLPAYSNDVRACLDIVQELDLFTLESQTISIKTYMEILRKKLSEHVHFIERVALTSPGIVFVFDIITRKEIYTNDKMFEIFGYAHEEVQAMGSNILVQIVHPDDLPLVDQHIREFSNAADGEIRDVTYRMKEKKGTYRWVKTYNSVFKRTADGTPWELIGITLDVNAEKRMSDALIQREEQLLEAQELSDMGSFEWDLTGNRKSQLSPQLKKILELDEAVTLEEYLSRIHPSDVSKLKQAISSALDETGIFECEYRYLGKQKEKVLWSKGRVNYADGKPVNMKGTVMDVTDQHQLLHQLQESGELYKQAQSLAHIGNWRWDIQKNTVYWSDELYRVYGLEPQCEQITYERYLSFVHPDEREMVKNAVRLAIEENRSYEFQHPIVLADGQVRIIHANGELIKDADGNPLFLVGTAQDVTEKQKLIDSLLENQTFIKKIADATPSIIASYNIKTGTYRFVSDGLRRLLGYEPELPLREGVEFFEKLVHPQDLPTLVKKNTDAIEEANRKEHAQNDPIIELTYRMLNRNGEYRWFQTFGTIFDRDSSGQVEHVLNITIDITERLEAERKIKQQEHFIQHIADASPTILYLYDLEMQRIVYINHEARFVLGYELEEILALPQGFMSLYHPDDLATVLEYKKELYNRTANGIVEYECRIKDDSGNYVWLLIKEVIFENDDFGNPTQLLGAALDITERKEMENAISQKNVELQQSNSSLEEFAYVASHDLKEPLRKISVFGDKLLRSEYQKLTEDGRLFMEKIIDSSKRMQTLITDLLSVSMISADKSFQPFSLQQILDEAKRALEHKIEEKGAVIEANELPVANVIPTQFRQLFQNLLGNSLKFVQPDVRPVIKIESTWLQPKEVIKHQLVNAKTYLQLKFSDNGIGFDNQFAGKIFAIFQRLHARNEYEGTGIGLAICKKIVENHGGTIFATGAPGEGACFTIIIPA